MKWGKQSGLRKIAAIAIYFLLGSFAPSAWAGDDSKANGWILHQSTAFVGNQVVHISPVGIKVICEKSGMIFVSLPPFDKFDLYNPKTRKIFHGPTSSFESPIGIGECIFNGFAFSHIPLVKDKVVFNKGLAGSLYKSTQKFALSQIAKTRNRDMATRNPKTVEFVVTEWISTNPAVHRAMCNSFGLPQAPGVPIEFAYRDIDNDLHKYLIMQKCQRETVRVEDFAVPVGFKVSTSIQDVNMGSVYDSEAVRMMFGGESDRKSK